MKRLAAAALSVCALLCACAQRLPVPGADTRVGGAFDVPLGVVSGRSSAVDFFSRKRFGSGTVDAALADARRKGGGQAEGIRLVSAQRSVLCFPLCDFPLVRYARTVVTAELLGSAHETRAAARTQETQPALSIGEPPPTVPLERRLEHLFASDPAAAASFYQSLDQATRDDLRDAVLSSTGRVEPLGDSFALDPALPEARRRFAEWFIGRFTSYSLASP